MTDTFKPSVPHEDIVVLLDAYLTDELEQNERQQVEKHLPTCLQCQQALREIQGIRQRFIKFSRDENSIQSSKNYQNLIPSPAFVDTIMGKILMKGSGSIMQHSRQNEKIRRWRLYSGIAALICACILIISIATIHYIQSTQTSSRVSGSVGSPKYWDTRENQMTIQNKDFVFAIKNISYTNQEFQFFYAMKSSESLHIQFASLVNNTGAVSLTSHDQSLGKLDGYTIGVLHVQFIHRLNQVITIEVTSPDHLTPLTLQPMKELAIDDIPGTRGGVYVDQNNFPDITWSGPVMIQQVAFFKDTSNKNAGPDAPHLFVRLDQPNVVTVISKAEYLAIAGQENYF